MAGKLSQLLKEIDLDTWHENGLQELFPALGVSFEEKNQLSSGVAVETSLDALRSSADELPIESPHAEMFVAAVAVADLSNQLCEGLTTAIKPDIGNLRQASEFRIVAVEGQREALNCLLLDTFVAIAKSSSSKECQASAAASYQCAVSLLESLSSLVLFLQGNEPLALVSQFLDSFSSTAVGTLADMAQVCRLMLSGQDGPSRTSEVLSNYLEIQ